LQPPSRNSLSKNEDCDDSRIWSEGTMPKPAAQEIETVIAFDRDTGVLDLRVYAHHSKRRPAQLVGTATLRMEDMREVLPLLTEQLRFEDLCIEAEIAAKKSEKRRTARFWAYRVSTGTVVASARNGREDDTDKESRLSLSVGSHGNLLQTAFADPRFRRTSEQTFDEAGLAQALTETGEHVWEWASRLAVEEPDHRYRRLLRVHRERPRRCHAAAKCKRFTFGCGEQLAASRRPADSTSWNVKLLLPPRQSLGTPILV
jgi:hypothetical protein